MELYQGLLWFGIDQIRHISYSVLNMDPQGTYAARIVCRVSLSIPPQARFNRPFDRLPHSVHRIMPSFLISQTEIEYTHHAVYPRLCELSGLLLFLR